MSLRRKALAIAAAAVIGGLASVATYVSAQPKEKVIKMTAKRFDYTPGHLTLKKGEPVAGQTLQSIQPVLTGVSEDVAAELQKTLDFFQATSGAERVDAMYISGGCSKVTNLDNVLKDKFGIPVEILNPFRSVATDDRAADPTWLIDASPSLAVSTA